MKQKYSDFLAAAEQSNDYWVETAISDFTKEICRIMVEKNISRTLLAERLGATPAYVTKVLRGNVNFTLSTMTKLARGIGMIVRIHLAPDGVMVRWIEESPKGEPDEQIPQPRKVVPITGTRDTFTLRPELPVTSEIRAANTR